MKQFYQNPLTQSNPDSGKLKLTWGIFFQKAFAYPLVFYLQLLPTDNIILVILENLELMGMFSPIQGNKVVLQSR
jgi:hypothetical protein